MSSIAPIEGIPPEFMPVDEQMPAWAQTTADDARRFAACFAIGRRTLGYDNPGWVRELYRSSVPTDPPAA